MWKCIKLGVSLLYYVLEVHKMETCLNEFTSFTIYWKGIRLGTVELYLIYNGLSLIRSYICTGQTLKLIVLFQSFYFFFLFFVFPSFYSNSLTCCINMLWMNYFWCLKVRWHDLIVKIFLGYQLDNVIKCWNLKLL